VHRDVVAAGHRRNGRSVSGTLASYLYLSTKGDAAL
jgi:hypothetical protein